MMMWPGRSAKPVAALATGTGENVENSSAGLNVKDLVNCGLSTGDAVRICLAVN